MYGIRAKKPWACLESWFILTTYLGHYPLHCLLLPYLKQVLIYPAALHIKHLKPLARGASKKRTSLAPTKPTGPKVLGQRNTTSTESQDAIVRLYDTFIMFSAAGGHIALRQHIALLLVRHQSADCPPRRVARPPGPLTRPPPLVHRIGLLKTVQRGPLQHKGCSRPLTLPQLLTSLNAIDVGRPFMTAALRLCRPLFNRGACFHTRAQHRFHR